MRRASLGTIRREIVCAVGSIFPGKLLMTQRGSPSSRPAFVIRARANAAISRRVPNAPRSGTRSCAHCCPPSASPCWWAVMPRRFTSAPDAIPRWLKPCKTASMYLPDFLPLPHPSPRNQLWFKRHPWFDKEIVSLAHQRVAALLGDGCLTRRKRNSPCCL